MNNFPVWLDQQMRERDVTQAELSRMADITQAAISRVLTGDRKPGTDFCDGIAKALKLPQEEVYRAAGLLPAESPQSTLDKRITHLVSLLPDEKKADVLDYVEMVVKRTEERGKRVLKKTGPLTPQA